MKTAYSPLNKPPLVAQIVSAGTNFGRRMDVGPSQTLADDKICNTDGET